MISEEHLRVGQAWLAGDSQLVNVMRSPRGRHNERCGRGAIYLNEHQDAVIRK